MEIAPALVRSVFPELSHLSDEEIRTRLKSYQTLLALEPILTPPGTLFSISFPFTFSIPDILARRTTVKGQLGSNYPELTNSLLTRMFNLYDYFFTGYTFSRYIDVAKAQIRFTFSDRLSSSAGNCKQTGECEYTVKISQEILLRITPETVRNQRYSAGGLIPLDRLDALMFTFEHELIHLMINVARIRQADSHGPLFQQMVRGLFGQTDIRHGLRTEDISEQMEQLSLNRSDLRVGQLVSFQGRQNRETGKILKLNPTRAKVETPLGVYNVPYHLLRNVI